MEIFSYDWIGLVITGLASLFLIGEILVNMRGFFAILGIGFITVYFSVYVQTDLLMLMMFIYFIGLVLIILDGKLLNDGTLATIGLFSMLLAVALPAPNIFAGIYAVIGVMAGLGGSFLFLKVFPRREMWTKMTLKDQLTDEAGYSSINTSYRELVGKQGITVTNMRPVGTIRIDGKDYSAISNGQWLMKDMKVTVIQVDGTRILVEEVQSRG
ncbi:NfeD family protein [Virgibacillus soli]|uniref:NfeD family protein n=1 Tax=Paracerasibacillus soli TaxID=480284 RepID=A0ABU5CQ10_9BACI|nr:NfeD family protein [Virgibacillus soli]MDY0408453.1 NfeD family protein [Virgibacillus soli]